MKRATIETLQKRVAGLGLLAIAATAAHAQTPVVDCVVPNTQTGMYTAYFGYTGTYTSSSTIPLGGSNYVDSGAVLRGSPPTSFPPNSQHMLFSLTFGSGVTPGWHLNGSTATANSSAATSCQVPVGTQLPVTSQTRCWDLKSDLNCDPSDDVDGDGFCTILDCVGPPGMQGPQGSVGPQGNAGPAGVAGTAPQFQTVTASLGFADASAACGSQQFLVTGGGVCSGAGLVESSTPSGNGWAMTCDTGQATAVAVCAAGTDVIANNAAINVSGLVAVTQTGFVRNRATGLWVATMTVTNIAGAPIGGPIQVEITNLPSNVTMTNYTGMSNGIPFITVSTGTLAMGASGSVTIMFQNPSNGIINLTPVTLSGSV